MKRTGPLVTAALAIFTLAPSLTPRAAAQEAPLNTAQALSQYDGPKQVLNIVYPYHGVVLSGTGDDEVKYTGLIYVSVLPISPQLRKKFGTDPVFSDEMHPSPGSNDDDTRNPQLPLGKYEVDFSMRDGDTMRTCIKRGILLTANGSANVQVEMSGTAKTLVIGGDVSYQTLEDAVGGMARQVAVLQAEVDALKGKAGAASAK